MSKEKMIIKKSHSQEEHKKKGAWKIAYADFVTAMMAFFLIMWLISVSSQEDLEKMSSFFNMTNTISEKDTEGSNNNSNDSNLSSHKQHNTRLDQIKLEEFFAKTKLDRNDEKKYRKIINNLRTHSGLQEFLHNVFLDITDHGLRIQIVDTIERPMFQPDTDIMSKYLQNTLVHLSTILFHAKNFFAISGHTRQTSQSNANDIWLLSFLRANQVRKFLLAQNKLFSKNILSVAGKADRDLMHFDDPENPQNIRVEIILLNESSLDIRYKNIPANFLD